MCQHKSNSLSLFRCSSSACFNLRKFSFLFIAGSAFLISLFRTSWSFSISASLLSFASAESDYSSTICASLSSFNVTKWATMLSLCLSASASFSLRCLAAASSARISLIQSYLWEMWLQPRPSSWRSELVFLFLSLDDSIPPSNLCVSTNSLATKRSPARLYPNGFSMSIAKAINDCPSNQNDFSIF